MDGYWTIVLIFINLIFSSKGITSQTVLNISPYPTATVTENDSTTLTCTYSQDGKCPNSQVLFQWYLDGVEALRLGWDDGICIYRGGNTSNLEFSCRSAQTYCETTLTLKQVRNSQHNDKWKLWWFGNATDETSIFVNVPTTAVQLTSPSTSSVSVIENVPYNFVCETSAGRPQATVQWYKRYGSVPEVAIPGGSTITVSSSTLIITRSTLGYTATRADDEGYRIYCKARNIGPSFITSSQQSVMSILYVPVIQSIQNRDVSLASPLTVQCVTTPGYPEQTSYRWTRSGGGSWSQPGQTLTISRVEKTDDGVYTCTAWNVMTPTGGTQVNGEVSTNFTLNVLYAPVIQSIQDRDGIHATPLTVQCVTTAGNPPRTSYRWTRSGDSSWGQTGQTLSISRVEKTDAADYTCTAWNVMTPTGGTQVKGEVSTTFTLNVLYAPVIQPIQNRDVVLASPLTVQCVTTAGNPPQTSYRWKRSGGGSWSQTGRTLNISRVEKTDTGVYTCTAWNIMTPTGGTQVNGEVSTTFTLNVLYAPVIQPIQNQNIVLSSPMTLQCTTTAGNPPQTSYRWTRSGGGSWSQDGQNLSISRVVKTHAGDYTCTAWNVMTPTGGTQVNGEVSTTFTLNVLYKASITNFNISEETGDGPYTVDENSQRTFRCEVDSNPASQIQIARADGILLARKNNTLSVTCNKSLGCHDAGKYECKGNNNYNGDIKSTEELELFVRCPPRPVDSVNNYTYHYALNETVTLNLTITAYPKPTFKWYKQGVEITIGVSQIAMGVSQNGHQTNLTLEQITHDDLGQYKVVVTNNQGILEHLFFVAAHEMAPAVNGKSENSASVIAGAVGGSAVALILTVIVLLVVRRYNCAKGFSWCTLSKSGSEQEQRDDISTHHVYVNTIASQDTMGSKDNIDRNMYEDLNMSHLQPQLYEQLQHGEDETCDQETDKRIITVRSRVEWMYKRDAYETLEHVSVQPQLYDSLEQTPDHLTETPKVYENLRLN